MQHGLGFLAWCAGASRASYGACIGQGVPLDCNIVKLIDFGFARRFGPGTPTLQTVCGSPGFMAPEIISGQDYDERRGARARTHRQPRAHPPATCGCGVSLMPPRGPHLVCTLRPKGADAMMAPC